MLSHLQVELWVPQPAGHNSLMLGAAAVTHVSTIQPKKSHDKPADWKQHHTLDIVKQTLAYFSNFLKAMNHPITTYLPNQSVFPHKHSFCSSLRLRLRAELLQATKWIFSEEAITQENLNIWVKLREDRKQFLHDGNVKWFLEAQRYSRTILNIIDHQQRTTCKGWWVSPGIAGTSPSTAARATLATDWFSGTTPNCGIPSWANGSWGKHQNQRTNPIRQHVGPITQSTPSYIP